MEEQQSLSSIEMQKYPWAVLIWADPTTAAEKKRKASTNRPSILFDYCSIGALVGPSTNVSSKSIHDWSLLYVFDWSPLCLVVGYRYRPLKN